ncbi:MAG: S1 RNA-binding domain-containing protein [Anaerolineae bacterium]|nr:S1 RNA-binding domain-containing protein [Anaerolineae bacterium]
MPEETVVQPTSIQELQPKMSLQGTVTRTELYGAFVDIGVEREGLIHISRLAPQRTKKVTDKVSVGDKVNVWVLNVEPQEGRIGLTMVEPPAVDWDELTEGQVRTGHVVRMERYGVFVDIGAERPGLLHVREMGQYVRNPSDVLREGEEIEVKILSLNRRKRQIDLTMHLESEDLSVEEEEDEPFLSPMEMAFRDANIKTSARKSRRDNKRKRRRSNDYEDIYRRTLGE